MAMEKVNQVLEGLTLSKELQTGHGQSDHINSEDRNEYIDVINRVFGILEVNYHNQFFSAYDGNHLDMAKKLWLSKLSSYSPEVILKATDNLLTTSDYLPTINAMIEACKALTVTKALHRTYEEPLLENVPSEANVRENIDALKDLFKD